MLNLLSAIASTIGSSPSTAERLCKHCESKPFRKDYDFCGKSCEQAADKQARSQESDKTEVPKACVKCHDWNGTNEDICRHCQEHGDASLKEVVWSDPPFAAVCKQFQDAWVSITESPKPQVGKIYEILNPSAKIEAYNAYMESQSGQREVQTYFGSLMICEMETPNLCALPACGICRVVSSSFRHLVFHERFEPGSMMSKNSYVADKDAISSTSSPYRVVILCDTIGYEFPFYREDEVMVPVSHAILPRYIIMYSRDEDVSQTDD